METVADSNRLAYVGSQVRGVIDADNDDWYTPAEWIEAARYILYGIDLDPFSSELANQRVRANKYFTQEDDAFSQAWEAKTVWMNPPYTRGLVDKAVTRFVEEFRAGHFQSGLVLVNNMTDTKWYRRLLLTSSLHCNIMGRIQFENAAGQRISGNTRGQSLFLFGKSPNNKARFAERMSLLDQVPLAKIGLPCEKTGVRHGA